MTVERRMLVRAEDVLAPSADGRAFSGRVAPYMSRTYIGPAKRGFFEQIDPGAFTRSLKEDDIVALWNHNVDHVLGRTASGTVRLENRDDGLYDEIDLPDTTVGNDVRHLVARGDVRGQSFGFEVRADEWGLVPGGHAQLRTLKDVRLFDVSPVTMPAYADTTASVRSAYHGAVPPPESRDGVADYGLQSMLAATDASIDAALIAVSAGNQAQAAANLTAAAVTVDQAGYALWAVDVDLLKSLGLPDVTQLVQSLDSAIDAALGAVASGTPDPDVLGAAEAASDACLAALHIPDPDDEKPLPGQEDEEDEGAGVRRLQIAAARTRAVGRLYRLP